MHLKKEKLKEKKKRFAEEKNLNKKPIKMVVNDC